MLRSAAIFHRLMFLPLIFLPMIFSSLLVPLRLRHAEKYSGKAKVGLDIQR